MLGDGLRGFVHPQNKGTQVWRQRKGRVGFEDVLGNRKKHCVLRDSSGRCSCFSRQAHLRTWPEWETIKAAGKLKARKPAMNGFCCRVS